jgi:transcriptional regulator with XRE-family HTH domain
MDNLGKRIRFLRESKQLSLRSLALKVGFSASFLSQVENGQASPSISSMERIALGLGTTLGRFFQDAEHKAPVVAAEHRLSLHSGWSRAKIESLASSYCASKFEPVMVTLQPNGTSGSRPQASPHEEFAFVLKGQVTLTLNDQEYALKRGDAVTIASGTLRLWQSRVDEPVQILIVSVY